MSEVIKYFKQLVCRHTYSAPFTTAIKFKSDGVMLAAHSIKCPRCGKHKDLGYEQVTSS